MSESKYQPNFMNGDTCEIPIIKEGKTLLEYASEHYDRRKYDEAFAIYKEAALTGDAEAQFRLAKMSRHPGLSTKLNAIQAYEWVLRAAEQGHEAAKNELNIFKNAALAAGMIDEKARDDNYALFNQAFSFYYDDDYDKALNLFKRVVPDYLSKGDRMLTFKAMGAMYAYGWGTKCDYMEAKKYFELAIELGCIDSMLRLGDMYNSGNGVKTNYFQAKNYYKMAADLGNDEAMLALGLLYVCGHGVKEDKSEGIKWMEKAANLGNDYAADMLKRLYNIIV